MAQNMLPSHARRLSGTRLGGNLSKRQDLSDIPRIPGPLGVIFPFHQLALNEIRWRAQRWTEMRDHRNGLVKVKAALLPRQICTTFCGCWPRGVVGEAPASSKRMATAAERMEDEVLSIDREIAGQDYRPSGRLRLTSSGTLAYRTLTSHLAAFRRTNPGIIVELRSTTACSVFRGVRPTSRFAQCGRKRVISGAANSPMSHGPSTPRLVMSKTAAD
jgi:hypothetical protein